MNLELLQEALENSWGPDTAQSSQPDRGCSSGQCSASALVVQYYFGGQIWAGYTDGRIKHYVNVIGTETIDTTKDQLAGEELVFAYQPTLSELIFKDTLERFVILLGRVEAYLEGKN
jgi:hypothetical protein